MATNRDYADRLSFNNMPGARAERTRLLLESLKGQPDEYEMLRGILNMARPFKLGSDDEIVAVRFFDGVALSQRMHMILCEARARELHRGEQQ
jgi:hypothetical protein